MLRRLVISMLLAAASMCAVARTRPHYGGTLRVETTGDAWQPPNGLARRLVFDGLMQLDANGIAEPALAIDAESENRSHRWEFHLRSGVHFHDGTALTAGSVVASLNAVCSSNCPWTSVHAVGTSVIFLSDSPMPNLPQLLALDEYRIALVTSDTTGASNVGTGPFQFAGAANGVITLTANESHWQGRPFVDKIELRDHRAVRDQWLDLSLGRADVVDVPPELLRLAREQRLSVITSQPAVLLAIEMNDAGPLANASLRASLGFAVDRASLSNVIFQHQGESAASLLPQEMTGYSFLFPVVRDLNKAHELKGGLNVSPLILGADNDSTMQLAAQRLALNMQEAGFRVQVTTPLHHLDMILRKVDVPDMDTGAALEATIRRLGETPVSTEQTAIAQYQAEHDFLDKHSVLPLLFLPRGFATSSRILNLRLDSDGMPMLADASLEDAH
ncbi:ABC transporter substrate-binding protein [Acidicapsa dinghuensis]|uniref:ABC transporter substrate-binding protein n=1 Tax=Acidicapsa dinghuensis TaxID=2218256 RepID=A0ABW1ELW7_9BACT|nr:ABC transporter substrate-binding protein [Acidicapsa dinghuensis]